MIPSGIKPWRSLNWPNRISLMRLLLVGPFVVLLMNLHNWPWARHCAVGIFVLMAVSDFVDGQLARRLNLRTRLGAVLDPLADKALIISSVILMALPDFDVPGHPLPNWVVVAVVAKDLWVIVGFATVFLVTGKFLVRPTSAGKASTVGQLTMVITVLLTPDLDRLHAALGNHMALIAEFIVAGLALLAVISYTRVGLSFVQLAGQQPIDRQ